MNAAESFEGAVDRAQEHWRADRAAAIVSARERVETLRAIPYRDRFPSYKSRELDHWQNFDADLSVAEWVLENLEAAEAVDGDHARAAVLDSARRAGLTE